MTPGGCSDYLRTAMKAAVWAGLTLQEYQDTTPGELYRLLRIHRELEEARQEEQNARLYLLARMTASFAMEDKIPAYEEIFGRPGEKNQEMSDEEMFEFVKMLNRSLGGSEVVTDGNKEPAGSCGCGPE